MRVEINSSPEGTKLVAHLGEHESLELNAGIEGEARAWRAELRKRIADSQDIEAIRRLHTSLASSKAELEELKSQESVLRHERRKLLEQGQGTSGVEKRLAALAGNQGLVSSRIGELDQIIAGRVCTAAAQILEMFDDVQTELFATTQRQKSELEKAFFDHAGPLIRKLVRLNRLSASRGIDQQRYRRQLQDGREIQIIEELIAAAEKPEPAAAAT
jgi:hypothetical protein